jgi:hypothetical protein
MCTSPTSISSSLLDRIRSNGVLTSDQTNLIVDVLAESSGLLGSDVAGLPLQDRHAVKLSLPAGTTYSEAIEAVATPRQARDFTGAVIALRKDPRVQGGEVEL